MGMLEHVSNPEIVVREMNRIIKPGGTIVAGVPFMQPFHAAPQDFYRWTGNGLQTLFSSFDDVKIEIAAGPTSGMLWVVDEWIAILLSFGNKTLHDLWFLMFMTLFFPLKYLDLIMERFSFSSNCASSFHVIAHKNIEARRKQVIERLHGDDRSWHRLLLGNALIQKVFSN